MDGMNLKRQQGARIFPCPERQIVKLRRRVELQEIGHGWTEAECCHEAAKDHVCRMPQRENELGIREQPMDEHCSVQCQGRLVDEKRARPKVEIAACKFEVAGPSVANIGSTQRSDRLETANLRLEPGEGWPLFKHLNFGMPHQHRVEQRRARARKSDEKDG